MKRSIRDDETVVIRALLLRRFNPEQVEHLLENANVDEMADGGMGSLRFKSTIDICARLAGTTIAEAEFVDDDGVLVSLVLNVDDRGEFFELDLWKVDFSPLRKFPTLQAIHRGLKIKRNQA